MNTRIRAALTAALAVAALASGACTSTVSGVAVAPNPSSAHTTVNSPAGAGTHADRTMVDVAEVWDTNPMPICDGKGIMTLTAVPSERLKKIMPNHDTVAQRLAGVRSPGSRDWVTDKLAWVQQQLGLERIGLYNADTGAAFTDATREIAFKSDLRMWNGYLDKVVADLEAGRDLPSQFYDTYMPDRCFLGK